MNKFYVNTNSVVSSWKGPNKLCRYNAAVSEVYGTIEGNTFQDKIQACKHITLFLRCFFFRNFANAPGKQTVTLHAK